MKKFFSIFLVIVCMVSGCNKKDNYDNIPAKKNSSDNNAMTSPINTRNIDHYMFRNDVQYVDLRSGESIINNGYIAGFEFIPYYSIIASFSEFDGLYQMKGTVDENGNRVSPGQIGGFVAQYEESKSAIESLFSKDKYIFIISIGGSESAYLINLLIQLGYDGNLLYNIGGVSNSDGLESYTSIAANKYYIQGHPSINASLDYGFLDDLTPISHNN
jgi:hypothetical protein